MAGSSHLHLLVLLLCVSHIICLHAAPITRTRSLQHKFLGSEFSGKSSMKNVEGISWNLETNSKMRMDLELNDYPGSGANNRHTPKPQLGRGCTEC